MSATHLTGPLIPIQNRFGGVEVLHNFRVNFNTTGISSGVKVGRIEASTLNPVLVRVFARVNTVFNAATTNVLTVGTSTTANEWLAGDDAVEGTVGTYPTNRLAGHEWFLDIAAAGTTGLITQYDLTGGAGAATVTASRPIHPRNVKITVTDANASISAYSITVAGTNPQGYAATETFTFADGLTPAGNVIFQTISTVTINSITGAGAGDTLDIGNGAKIGLAANGTGLVVADVIAAGTREAASATGATYNSVTFTTAPDGAKDFEVFYNYNAPTVGYKDFLLTADTNVYVKYTQSGTAATTGQADIFIAAFPLTTDAIA